MPEAMFAGGLTDAVAVPTSVSIAYATHRAEEDAAGIQGCMQSCRARECFSKLEQLHCWEKQWSCL